MEANSPRRWDELNTLTQRSAQPGTTRTTGRGATIAVWVAFYLLAGGLVASCGMVLGTDQDPITLDGYVSQVVPGVDALVPGPQDADDRLSETVGSDPTGKDVTDGPGVELPEVPEEPANEFKFFLANVEVVVSDHPPVAEFRDSEGRVIARSLPGIVSLLKLNESHLWDAGLAAVDILS